MEKTAILSQVPRPPKQIWEDEKPVEMVKENQDRAEENKERPSAITVVHPKTNIIESKNLGLDDSGTNENFKEEDIDTEAESSSQHDVPEEMPDSEKEGMGDENDIDELVAEPEMTLEPNDNKDLEEEPKNTTDFEQEANLAEKETRDVEDKIDFEVEENKDFENDGEPAKVVATNEENNVGTDEIEGLGNEAELEENIASALEVEENKAFEEAIEPEPIIVPELQTDIKSIENEAVGSEISVSTTATIPQKTTRVPEQVQGEIKIPNDVELYKRQYYTMGEVATMFNVNQSLIRFWENEFAILQPKKNKKGDRYFRPEDVKSLRLIHHLLRSRKFTIEGANEYLKNNKQRAADTVTAVESLQQLKSFLIELKANL